MSHFVYRLYDTDEQLIYVGSTTNIRTRLGAHKSKGFARYETVECETRDEALTLEAQIIGQERPLLNKRMPPKPGRIRVGKWIRVAIPTDLHKWLRIRAIKNGQTLQTYINEVLKKTAEQPIVGDKETDK